jgi:hypothetical protein
VPRSAPQPRQRLGQHRPGVETAAAPRASQMRQRLRWPPPTARGSRPYCPVLPPRPAYGPRSPQPR